MSFLSYMDSKTSLILSITSWEGLLALTVLEETRIVLFEKQIPSAYSKEIFYLSNLTKDKMAEFHN